MYNSLYYNAAGTVMALSPIAELRQRYHDDLFQRWLPLWDRHGIDHEHGGFICSLDYDGTRCDTNKFHWFQGRGIWVYSFLYNHFGQDLQYLEIARKAKDFLLQHAPQPDDWWAELLSREGRVLQPFRGDIYGMYFAAEGLQEYAWAAGVDQARQSTFDIL